MFYYEVGYDSYEEAPIVTLISEKEYTQDQFDELVSDCTIKVHNAPKDKEMYYSGTFGNIMDMVIKMLVSDFGFKEPIFQARFQPFGWASIVDENDWEQATKNDKQLNLIRKKIKDGKK